MAILERPIMRSELPAERANRILRSSAYHPIRHLTCTYHDGTLRIDGGLPSFHLKQVAQTLVQGIDGVHQIENRIEVVR